MNIKKIYLLLKLLVIIIIASLIYFPQVASTTCLCHKVTCLKEKQKKLTVIGTKIHHLLHNLQAIFQAFYEVTDEQKLIINDQQDRLTEQENHSLEMEATISLQENAVQQLSSEINALSSSINEQLITIDNQSHSIAQLEEQLSEVNDVLAETQTTMLNNEIQATIIMNEIENNLKKIEESALLNNQYYQETIDNMEKVCGELYLNHEWCKSLNSFFCNPTVDDLSNEKIENNIE